MVPTLPRPETFTTQTNSFTDLTFVFLTSDVDLFLCIGMFVNVYLVFRKRNKEYLALSLNFIKRKCTKESVYCAGYEAMKGWRKMTIKFYGRLALRMDGMYSWTTALACVCMLFFHIRTFTYSFTSYPVFLLPWLSPLPHWCHRPQVVLPWRYSSDCQWLQLKGHRRHHCTDWSMLHLTFCFVSIRPCQS